MNWKNASNDDKNSFTNVAQHICRALNDTTRITFGPFGKSVTIKLGKGRDGDLVVTTTSKRMADNTHVQHPISRLIMQTLKSHHNSVFDHGNTFLTLCTQLVLDHLEQDPVLTATVIEFCIEWSDEFFTNCPCRIPFNSTNISEQVRIAKSVLSANYLLGLKDEESTHLAIKVFEAFIKGLPPQTSRLASKKPIVKFATLVSDETDVVSHSKVLNSIIMDIPIAPETKMMLEKFTQDDVNIIVYESAIEYEAMFQVFKKSDQVYSNVPGVSIEFFTDKDENEEKKESAKEFYARVLQAYLRHDVRVVASQKTIHQNVKYLLARNNIVPIERVSLRFIQSLIYASNAILLDKVSHDIDPSTLGQLCKVRVEIFSGKEYVHIYELTSRCIVAEPTNDRRLTTLLLCANSEYLVQEMQTVCEQILGMLGLLLQSPYLLIGGGVTELLLAHYLRQRIKHDISSKRGIIGTMKNTMQQKLVQGVDKVASCIEEIIHVLAVSNVTKKHAIHTKEEMLTILKEQNKSVLDKINLQIAGEEVSYSPDEFTSWDILKQQPTTENPIDLFISKQQAIISALETAAMILRCDQVII